MIADIYKKTGTNPLDKKFRTFSTRIIVDESDRNVFFAGDIFDLKNSRKKDVQKYISDMATLSFACPGFFLFGNHEGFVGTINACPNALRTIGEKKVLITHGHREFWGFFEKNGSAKIEKWEGRRFSGLSNVAYMRYAIGAKFDELFLRNSVKRNEAFFDYIISKHPDQDVYIMGHAHPKKMCDYI